VTTDRYEYFREEARELLEDLTTWLLAREKGEGAQAQHREALRLAHTLKGAARVMGLGGTADLAHELEDRLAELEGTAPAPLAAAEAWRLLDQLAAAVDELGATPAEAEEAPAAAEPEEPEGRESIRVELAALTDLQEGIYDASLQVEQLRALALAGDRRRLLEALATLARTLEWAGNDARALRMRAAREIFVGLERATHDAAADADRRVAFRAEGGDVRLDGHVLAQVREALLHLVRNAVAHGIEPEADRVAAGKPPAGQVLVAVERRGGTVRFRCEDDGRGIDHGAVRRAAERQGLLPLDAAAELGHMEVQALILRPGFSTAASVTQLAGRGVGLDVLAQNIARLKGQLAIHSTPGKGTRVELEVPVSAAVVEVLLVRAGGVVAAIPFAAVAGATERTATEVVRSGDRDVVPGPDGPMPWLVLAEHLGWEPKTATAWPAVTVRGAQGTAAIAVDKLLGTADVVVRPLPPGVGPQALVVGAALGPDGAPRPVLDVEALVATARAPGRPPVVAPARSDLPILVIDDSLTTRMLERTILEAEGHEVVLATNAEEGLALARTRPFGLYVVDVEMPGMNGFEFVAATQADAALRLTPAIMVSSLSGPDQARRAEAAGARAYICKGEFDQRRFLALVDRLKG
jgi:two-component system chemotaxis sensor kinase CheA